MNYNEIIAALKQLGISTIDFLYGEFEPETVLPIGTFNTVDYYGGEGEGERYYKVYHIPEHNIYIRIDGWYYSYDGASCDDNYENCCRQVIPQEKTITVYE